MRAKKKLNCPIKAAHPTPEGQQGHYSMAVFYLDKESLKIYMVHENFKVSQNGGEICSR